MAVANASGMAAAFEYEVPSDPAVGRMLSVLSVVAFSDSGVSATDGSLFSVAPLKLSVTDGSSFSAVPLRPLPSRPTFSGV